MKNRYSTIDIRAAITEIREKYLGMRIANCYDIDNKTYLIKLAKPDFKIMILLESGNRIHSTQFEWPKNMSPSGFSMKLRKHLRTRRLEKIEQLGIDRIVDMQFGSDEAAYHVILELYDRGNIVLTDFEYTILNILRPRTDESQDVRFAVKETYPIDTARQVEGAPTEEQIRSHLQGAKEGDNLKKILIPHLVYGPAVIEHCLLSAGFPANARLGKECNLDEDIPKLLTAMGEAEELLQKTSQPCKGYIIQKMEKKPNVKPGEDTELLTYNEFHPFLFKQHEKMPFLEFDSFDRTVDEFFSKIGTQKLDMKALQQEKSALKKLENIKKDHEKRITGLKTEQEMDKQKAQLIETNLDLVDRAIKIVQSAIANQIDWDEINNIVKEAQVQGDPVAKAIKTLKLGTNHMTLLLEDPYDFEDSDDEVEGEVDDRLKPMKVDIDLALSAYANARKFYDMKRHASTKEQKTVGASSKALKSAERKTKDTLKEVQTTASINKARKTYWFEKFLWFLSSENYLIIGGRDQQQNELIVKKYMRPGDLYVHADLHGASSVIIKNIKGEPVPPKTLNEAGTMAVCNSAAWDAKVVTSAWWVYHDQVSKTAPTGEYLTTGSFMIRGKKNFLPPCYLVYGFSFLFKLDDESIYRHKDERKVRTLEDMMDSEAVSTRTDDSTVITGSVSEASFEANSDDDDDQGQVEDEGDDDDDCDEKEMVDEGEELTNQEQGGKGDPQPEKADSEEESLFPDTTIELQHVKGGEFKLQRNISTMSASSKDEELPQEDTDKEMIQGSKKLTAKQKREMKKKAKKGLESTNDEESSESLEKPKQVERPQSASKKEPSKPNPQSQQPKRGQKAKLKKIKEKYGDQDEEERKLKMEILASGGEPKEDKKMAKKGKQKQMQMKKMQPNSKNANRPKGTGEFGKLTIQDIKTETPTVADGISVEPVQSEMKANDDGNDSDEEKQAILEEEKVQIMEDASTIDSLTGQPVIDDILLFAVPVCAPYSALVNYKYKVKLTPGNTKRGKAVKTALNMYQNDRTASLREKDLFKSVKDVDLSRNMPGKVKVSAPNLHKSKKK